MKKVRCSVLPILMQCSRSLDDVDLVISDTSAPADMGSAVHEALSCVVEDVAFSPELLCARYSADAKEFGMMVSFGRKAWEELQSSFPLPETEVEVMFSDVKRGIALTGHIDVLSIIGNSARGIDWKSGRKEETDYYSQLAGYASCLIMGHYVAEVTFTVVWLRSQTVETYTFRRQEVVEFMDRVQNHLNVGAYTHGEHCGYCRRSHECEALIRMGRRDMAMFMAGDEASLAIDLSALAPAQVVDLRRRAKMLEKFAASLDSMIRWRVSSSGPLPSGDGYALSLVEENGKREIDTEKAWPILQDRLTDVELAKCVTVSAADVDDCVAKKAGRGNGKKAREALATELKLAGALEQKKVLKLKEVRLPRELSAKGESK